MANTVNSTTYDFTFTSEDSDEGTDTGEWSVDAIQTGMTDDMANALLTAVLNLGWGPDADVTVSCVKHVTTDNVTSSQGGPFA